jgi:hypothetical protein
MGGRRSVQQPAEIVGLSAALKPRGEPIHARRHFATIVITGDHA